MRKLSTSFNVCASPDSQLPRTEIIIALTATICSALIQASTILSIWSLQLHGGLIIATSRRPHYSSEAVLPSEGKDIDARKFSDRLQMEIKLKFIEICP